MTSCVLHPSPYSTSLFFPRASGAVSDTAVLLHSVPLLRLLPQLGLVVVLNTVGAGEAVSVVIVAGATIGTNLSSFPGSGPRRFLRLERLVPFAVCAFLPFPNCEDTM